MMSWFFFISNSLWASYALNLYLNLNLNLLNLYKGIPSITFIQKKKLIKNQNSKFLNEKRKINTRIIFQKKILCFVILLVLIFSNKKCWFNCRKKNKIFSCRWQIACLFHREQRDWCRFPSLDKKHQNSNQIRLPFNYSISLPYLPLFSFTHFVLLR